MGRFAPKYSDDQRAAIVRAQVDDGLSAEKAVKRAREGQLYGLPAFEFALGTARDYGGKERRRRRGEEMKARQLGTPEERTDALIERCLSILEHALYRAETRCRKDVAPEDIDYLQKLGRAAREMRSLTRGMAAGAGGSAKRRQAEAQSAAKPKDAEESKLVSDLLIQHREGSGPAHAHAAAPNGDKAHELVPA